MTSTPTKTTIKKLGRRSTLHIILPFEEYIPDTKQFLYLRLASYIQTFASSTIRHLTIDGQSLSKTVCKFPLHTWADEQWHPQQPQHNNNNNNSTTSSNTSNHLQTKKCPLLWDTIRLCLLEKLTHLTIFNCRLFSNNDFFSVILQCKDLIDLTCEHCPGVNGNVLTQMNRSKVEFYNRPLTHLRMCGTSANWITILRLNHLFDYQLSTIDLRRTPAFNMFITSAMLIYSTLWKHEHGPLQTLSHNEHGMVVTPAQLTQAFRWTWCELLLDSFHGVVSSMETLNVQHQGYMHCLQYLDEGRPNAAFYAKHHIHQEQAAAIDVINAMDSASPTLTVPYHFDGLPSHIDAATLYTMRVMYDSLPGDTLSLKAGVALTSVAAIADLSLSPIQLVRANCDLTQASWENGMLRETQLLTCTACANAHSPPAVLERLLEMGSLGGQKMRISAQFKWGDYNYFTPLMGAAQASSLPKVNLLLQYGAQVTSACHNGQTALHFALASQNGSAGAVVKRLLQQVGLQHVMQYREPVTGYTLLHRAAQESSLTTFKKILGCGIDVNVQGTVDGKTALFFALDPEVDHESSYDMNIMVHLLLSHGAALEVREYRYGDTPLLHVLRQFGAGGNWDPHQDGWKDGCPSSSIRRGQVKRRYFDVNENWQ